MRSDRSQVTILIDRRPTNICIREKNKAPYFMDLVLCVEGRSGIILGHAPAKPEEDDTVIAKAAREALGVLREQFGRVQVAFAVRQDRVEAALAAAFASDEVVIEKPRSFDLWDEAYLEMDKHMGAGGTMLPYLWSGDLTEEEVAEFFEAAVQVYKSRPWRFFTDADILEIRDPRSKSGSLVVSVMGSEGMSRGIAVFPSMTHYEDVVLRDSRTPTALFVSFQQLARVPHTIAAEAEQHGWAVANKSAFPALMSVRKGKTVAAKGDDVRRATAALHAVSAAANSPG